MRVRTTVAVLLALSAGAAHAGEGIVRIGADGAALLFATESLAASDTVWFQYANGAGRTRCCARAAIDGAPIDGGPARPSDQLGGAVVQAYRLGGITPAEIGKPFVGAAVFGSDALPRPVSATTLRIVRAKSDATVTACTTQEGMHLLTLAGGKRVTHLYLGFDHAVKPSCPPSAWRAIEAAARE